MDPEFAQEGAPDEEEIEDAWEEEHVEPAAAEPAAGGPAAAAELAAAAEPPALRPVPMSRFLALRLVYGGANAKDVSTALAK